MTERLTDEELTRLMSDAEDMHSMYWIAAVSELRERRAQDLTAEEVEALRHARDILVGIGAEDRPLDVLDKLIAAAEARRDGWVRG